MPGYDRPFGGTQRAARAHPAWATASELIQLTADFGIKETTLRVALTRMVGAGDLVRSADGYRLGSVAGPPAPTR